ncbi:MAG: type IV pilus modification protein PilV [Parahaliea sp.]
MADRWIARSAWPGRSTLVTGTGRQAGFGLLEVMIALLLVMVGMLGLLRLQLLAQQQLFESSQRTVATILARDVLERIHGNPDQLAAYAGLGTLGQDGEALGPDCEATYCSPAERVDFDAARWQRVMAGAGAAPESIALTRPRLCVAASGPQVRVELAWRGSAGDPLPAGVGGGDNCGIGQGLYGDGDRLRRSVWLQSYLESG